MNNYNHYANMSNDAKDRLCNHENIQPAYEQMKFNNNSSNNNNRKSSLKRTESKMDHNQQESEDNPEVESEIDDHQWRYQNRPNKRGIKAPRTDSFVQGRTITSSSYGRDSGRMEKNMTRHTSPRQSDRKKEKKNDNQQLSNSFDGEYDSQNDIQYLGVKNNDRNSNKVYEKETGLQQSNNEDHVYVSRHALKFAVEDRLPPI
jgi:hypothetical protein